MAYIISPADYCGALARALTAANIPTISVTVGNPLDRSTWRIDYHPTATTQNRLDGETLKASLSMTDPTVVAREKALLAAGEITGQRAIQALATAIHKRFKASVPGDTVTAQQWANDLRSEFDALL